MTYYEFSGCSLSYQLALTLTGGIELAHRQEHACDVTLYYLPGNFFVEVHRARRTGEITRLRSFQHPALLERYVRQVRLPEWLA